MIYSSLILFRPQIMVLHNISYAVDNLWTAKLTCIVHINRSENNHDQRSKKRHCLRFLVVVTLFRMSLLLGRNSVVLVPSKLMLRQSQADHDFNFLEIRLAYGFRPTVECLDYGNRLRKIDYDHACADLWIHSLQLPHGKVHSHIVRCNVKRSLVLEQIDLE